MAPANDSPRVSLRSRPVLVRLAALVLPVVVLMAVAIAAVHARERAEDRERARRAGFEVVRLQSHTTVRVIEMVTSILLYMSEEAVLERFLGQPDAPSARAEVQSDLVHFCRSARMFAGARLYDMQGRRLLAVEAGQEGDPRPVEGPSSALPDLSRVSGQLAVGQVFVSAFDLARDAEGKLLVPPRSVIRFAALAPGPGGEPAGLLVLDYLGVSVLRFVHQTGLQVGGWTALIDGGGHYLEAPSNSLSWTGPRGLPPGFAQDHPDVWTAIAGGAEPQPARQRVGTLLDHRGLYVWSRVPTPEHRVAALSELELFAVFHSPTTDLYARSSRTLRLVLVGAAIALAILVAAAWRLAHAGTVRAEQDRRLAESASGLRKLSARLVEVQEEERRRISRDLHDELGQQATAIAIGLKRAARAESAASRGELLEGAIAATDELLAGVHRIATSLRTTILDDLGLAAALEAACADLRERAGLPVRLELALEGAKPSPDVTRAAYRLVQEGLTNAMKHARAGEVRVRLALEPGPTGQTLSVEVRDDGVGFDPRARNEDRLGLLGMRERVELAGGALRCESSPGAGTLLAARFPLDTTPNATTPHPGAQRAGDPR